MTVGFVILFFKRSFVELLEAEGADEVLWVELLVHGRDAPTCAKHVNQHPYYEHIVFGTYSHSELSIRVIVLPCTCMAVRCNGGRTCDWFLAAGAQRAPSRVVVRLTVREALVVKEAGRAEGIATFLQRDTHSRRHTCSALMTTREHGNQVQMTSRR